MRFFINNDKHHLNFWFLLGLFLLFFFLRLPSFSEPYWYGDEGIYQTIGLGLRKGLLLYRDIWDNKPPLLYLLYAFLGSKQEILRFTSFLFGVLSIFIFYFLTKKLNFSKKSSIISTTLFALLLGLPTFEGNIANAENFLILPDLFAIFLFMKVVLNNNKKQSSEYMLLWLSGILLGIGFLIKTVAIFDYLTLVVFLLLSTFPKKIKLDEIMNYFKSKKKIFFIFSTAFCIALFLSFLFFLFHHALEEYIFSVFLGNINYVGTQNTTNIFLFKIILLFSFLVFIYIKRNKINKALLFSSLWFFFSLFNIFFTQRPYPHYILMLLPSFCLLSGNLFLKKGSYKYSIILILFLCSLLIITFFKPWGIDKTFGYYKNYVSYLSGNISYDEYINFFDKRMMRDYKVINYLKREGGKYDSYFFWGNNAQVYYLLNKLPPGKYTTAYHLLNTDDTSKEITNTISQKKPTFIVTFPEIPPLPYSMYNYKEKIIINGAKIYERIY